ncbi:MAG: cupin domain-containing protein [Syntrophaceae bacterium]|nr:cupin domain-containing protein [Syntrophaceae bacterium]
MSGKSCGLIIVLCLLVLGGPISTGWSYDNGVKVRTVLKSTTAGNGQPLEYMRTDRPEVTAAVVEIAPGAQTGWHLHRVPVYAYVLEGTLKVLMGDGTALTFEKGQAILEVQNTAHNGVNIGKEPVRLIVFYTGAVGEPLSEKLER